MQAERSKADDERSVGEVVDDTKEKGSRIGEEGREFREAVHFEGVREKELCNEAQSPERVATRTNVFVDGFHPLVVGKDAIKQTTDVGESRIAEEGGTREWLFEGSIGWSRDGLFELLSGLLLVLVELGEEREEGVRFKCLSCLNSDFCESCHPKHDKSHVFALIHIPVLFTKSQAKAIPTQTLLDQHLSFFSLPETILLDPTSSSSSSETPSDLIDTTSDRNEAETMFSRLIRVLQKLIDAPDKSKTAKLVERTLRVLSPFVSSSLADQLLAHGPFSKPILSRLMKWFVAPSNSSEMVHKTKALCVFQSLLLPNTLGLEFDRDAFFLGDGSVPLATSLSSSSSSLSSSLIKSSGDTIRIRRNEQSWRIFNNIKLTESLTLIFSDLLLDEIASNKIQIQLTCLLMETLSILVGLSHHLHKQCLKRDLSSSSSSPTSQKQAVLPHRLIQALINKLSRSAEIHLWKSSFALFKKDPTSITPDDLMALIEFAQTQSTPFQDMTAEDLLPLLDHLFRFFLSVCVQPRDDLDLDHVEDSD